MASLEASARAWRIGALAAVGMLSVVLLTGQAAGPRTIDAAGLRISDPASGARVQMAAVDGSPSIALHDAQGRMRAALAIEAGGPLFSLFGGGGEPRLVVGQRDGAAFVIVRDSEGAPRAAMAVQETGEPSLYLLDANLDPLFREPAGRDQR